MNDIILKLKNKNKTISVMESCTGGGVSNAITNIEGASAVFKFAAVTYSNEFKIKMGVSAKTIEKYSVYSREVAREMSLAISKFTNSDYGIGVTGKLRKIDENNLQGEDDAVYISIYDKQNINYLNSKIYVTKETREENKQLVIMEIINLLEKVL